MGENGTGCCGTKAGGADGGGQYGGTFACSTMPLLLSSTLTDRPAEAD